MTCAGNQVDPGGLGPDFIGGVKNVTVPEGRDVILSCTVVRLGTHKVTYSSLLNKHCDVFVSCSDERFKKTQESARLGTRKVRNE